MKFQTLLLKRLRIATNATAQGKLLSGGRMHHMQRALVAQQLLSLWPGGALGQLVLWYIRESLEIIVACVAKVCGAKAKEHRHGAAVAAFVFQEISAMFGAHLGACNVRTAAADKLLGIELLTHFRIAASLATIVRLLALEAHIVRIAIHGNLGDILAVRILHNALVLDAAN